MSSSPHHGPAGQSSDETAQFPAVRPAGAPGASAGADDDATMPGVAGYGIPPVTDQGPDTDDTARLPSAPPAQVSPAQVSPAPMSGAAPAAYPWATPSPADATAISPSVPADATAMQHPVPAAAQHMIPGFPPGQPGAGYPPPGTPPGPIGYGEGGPPGVPAKKKRRWLVPAVAGGAVVAVLLALTGGVMAFAGEVPRGTTVLGVDIGGGSKAEAAAALKQGLGDRVTDAVPVKIGDGEAEVHPEKVGLALDYEATAERAADKWPNPFTVLFGEREVAPVVTVDAAKLDDALQKLAVSATEKLTRPAIRYQGLTPKPVYPGAGRGLDGETSAKAVKAGWLRGKPIQIPIVELHSVTTKEDVDKLLAELAEPAVAAPVTVKTPKGEFTITPEAVAKSLIMESDEKGEIVPRVDAAKLREAAKEEFAKVETPAKDAKLSVQGGKLVASGEATGRAVDMKALTAGLLPVLAKAEPRELSAELIDAKPKLTKETIGKLGVKEKISSFTTHFKGGQDRNKNILVIADEVDSALVMPGKTFSLNGYTGERSYAQGYVDAPVIIGGKIKNHVGGGISQFATTIFNASYYAGMVDEFHRPHGYYISRYPSVIEATVFYPSLDLRFKNDSKYGVLIDTSYTDTSITVSMWSTKRYDIKTEYGEKFDHTSPKTVHLREKDCIPTEGIPGFAQEAYRVFLVNGKEIKRERFFWRYKAEPKFVCDDPSPSPSPG
ncbi:MAG: VanW family protein [Micromonosporaceae bacterium]